MESGIGASRQSGFTGYSNNATFRTLPLSEFPLSISAIRIFAFTWSSTFKKALLEGDVAWDEERIADFERIVAEQAEEISILNTTKQELHQDIKSLNNVIVSKATEIDYLTNEIKKIENEDVYDITVADNHNFFANGILVHNCAEIGMKPVTEDGRSGWQFCPRASPRRTPAAPGR